MKKNITKIPFVVRCYKLLRRLNNFIVFTHDFYVFKRQSAKTDNRLDLKWKDRYPCLDDKTSTTEFDRHYMFHPAWAVRILSTISPEVHVDISSILLFSALISAFIPVKFYDYRPANFKLSGLSCEQADLVSLPFVSRSLYSVSCMHVVEHIGMGRYGDTIDPDGDLKAISELQRVLAIGGSLLL